MAGVKLYHLITLVPTRMDSVEKGLQLTLDKEADVVNLSLESPPLRTDPKAQKVNEVVENGVVAVAAAGNKGPGYGTIGSPGTAKRAITVGAVDINGNIASFSARGPTQFDRRLKPEVVAPGVNIGGETADGNGGTKTEVRSGTSVATPMVSGVVELIRAEHPNWAPKRVKNVLVSTSTPQSENGELYDVYTQGAGLVNGERAIHTDLLIRDPVIDFQSVYGSDKLSKIIEVENIGDEPISIDISTRMRYIEKDDEYGDRVVTAPSDLSIEPNEVSEVELRVDPPKPFGIYSGRLFFECSSSVTYNAIFGFTKFPKTADNRSV